MELTLRSGTRAGSGVEILTTVRNQERGHQSVFCSQLTEFSTSGNKIITYRYNSVSSFIICRKNIHWKWIKRFQKANKFMRRFLIFLRIPVTTNILQQALEACSHYSHKFKVIIQDILYQFFYSWNLTSLLRYDHWISGVLKNKHFDLFLPWEIE